MAKPIISADSHITEPPNTYVDRIDAKFRDRAPHVVHDPQRGDLFIIEGLAKPIPMGLVAAAGKRAEELTVFGVRFEELHRGGWDPHARLADQDRDGRVQDLGRHTVAILIGQPRVRVPPPVMISTGRRRASSARFPAAATRPMGMGFASPSTTKRSPHIVHDPMRGDLFVIDGHRQAHPDGAGRRGRQARRGAGDVRRARSRTCTAGGWDPEARLADQDRDGVAARDPLPDGRHDALQPSRLRLQAGLLRRLQPVDRRVLRRPPRPADRHRADRDALGRGRHRGPRSGSRRSACAA